MKKLIIKFIFILIVLAIGAVLTVSLIKEISKNSKIIEEENGADTWSYKGTLLRDNENYEGDLYGIDTTLIYNSIDKTFYEKNVGMGTPNFIKYYIISNESIKLVVDSNVNVVHDFYSLNFNRPDNMTAPEDFCSSQAIITTQGNEKIIELKYNKNYKEGELKNIQISFGAVD